MKAFELHAGTRLKLTKVTPRKELHGDERVQAISLRVRQETTNDVLVKLHPNLQDMLFWRTPELEAQQSAPGIDPVKPFLRVPIVKLPLKLDLSFSGYTTASSTSSRPTARTEDRPASSGRSPATRTSRWSLLARSVRSKAARSRSSRRHRRR